MKPLRHCAISFVALVTAGVAALGCDSSERGPVFVSSPDAATVCAPPFCVAFAPDGGTVTTTSSQAAQRLRARVRGVPDQRRCRDLRARDRRAADLRTDGTGDPDQRGAISCVPTTGTPPDECPPGTEVHLTSEGGYCAPTTPTVVP